MKKLLFIFGTRPEAIKMAPIVRAFQANPTEFDAKVCVTAQHREMLDQVLEFFGIRPDFDLDLMKPNQSLFEVTASAIRALENVLDHFPADLVFVQGDTTTSFVGALAGYYRRIPVAHIEAGLRSGNKYSPFPEEVNRILTGHLTAYHFAPTEKARQNLLREGISDQVWVVGNSVIDALLEGIRLIDERRLDFAGDFDGLDSSRRMILVTGHRRESFGRPFEEICGALKDIASEDSIDIVYPVHLNPNVQAPVRQLLGGLPNVHLMDPVDYPRLIWLMNRSTLVLTDSGGIQEEAPSLGKPVLVMRDVTERTEGIEAGTARLVGTDRLRIVEETRRLLNDNTAYAAMAKSANPYGDGKTSARIVDIVRGLTAQPR